MGDFTAQFLDLLPQGIIVVDHEGRVVSYNQAARDLFGIDPRGEPGHPAGSLERGDLIILADNWLGRDDGEMEPRDLAEIGVDPNQVAVGKALVAIGEKGAKPGSALWKSAFQHDLTEAPLEVARTVRGVALKASINPRQKTLSIRVGETVFPFPYRICAGHLVALDAANLKIRFYQARGHNARREDAKSIIFGGLYQPKGPLAPRTEVLGKHLESVHPENVGTNRLLRVVRGEPDDLSPFGFEICGVPVRSSARAIRNAEGQIAGAVLIIEPIGAPTGTPAEDSPQGEHIQSAIVGKSPEIQEVIRTLQLAAKSNSTVLLLGESGTGKGVCAKAIHRISRRKTGPFVHVNCAAIPATLLESELFGYEEGAFTGARKGGQPGKFEQAGGGTIFLDEIGETSPSFQVRLLRVLQEQEIRRVGGNKTIKVDTRVIAATNRDLQQMVKAGAFREDLYYRLSVVELAVPPLRERGDDVGALLDHFLAEFGQKDQQTYRLHPEARRVLEAYSWPGNVRELGNAVENLTQLSRGREITVDDLPAKIQADVLKRALLKPEPSEETPSLIGDWPSLDELERRYIQILLGRHKEKQRIADILGVDRTTLYRKLKRYGFHDGE